VRHYDAAGDCVVSVECPKLYHMNIVWVLKAQDHGHEHGTIDRVRVILDKSGIRAIEEV
jgi:hypothetical protein